MDMETEIPPVAQSVESRSSRPKKPTPVLAPDTTPVSSGDAFALEALERAKRAESLTESMSVKMDTMFTILQGMSAKARGTGSEFRIEAGAFDEEKIEPAHFVEDRHGEVSLIQPVQTYDLDSPSGKSKLEIEKFNGEILTIEILSDTNPDSDMCFDIQLNGTHHLFFRNQTYRVRRDVVEALMSCKPIAYRNEEYTDRLTGALGFKYPSSRGLRYPFNIKNDPSGMVEGTKGGDWYISVMRRP